MRHNFLSSVICMLALVPASPLLQAQDTVAPSTNAPSTSGVTEDHTLDDASKPKLNQLGNLALPSLYPSRVSAIKRRKSTTWMTHKHEVVHTFGWYMTKYVADAQAKGATPIVMSLTPRNGWNNGKAVRACGENYGGWAEQVAKTTGAIFVDHNEIIAESLDSMGQDAGGARFADQKLHTSRDGAVLNATMAVSGLKAIDGNPFGPYLSLAADSIPAFKPASSSPAP